MLRKLGFTILWPGLFIYFLGSTRTRVLLRHDDEVLLIRDSGRYFFDPEVWTLPGGGVHRGEEPTVAAVRELEEELGIVLEPDSLRLLSRQASGDNGFRYTALFFDAVVAHQPTLHVPSREVRQARWFTPQAAQQLPLKREARQALKLLADQ